MSNLFPDTTLEAEQVLIELFRQTPAWRKLEIMCQMNQTVRDLALDGLKLRHPKATPRELHRRLAELLLGPELAERAYGPLVQG